MQRKHQIRPLLGILTCLGMLVATGCAGHHVPRRYHGPVVGNQASGWETVLHGPEVIVRRVGDGYADVPDRFYAEHARRDLLMGAAPTDPFIAAQAWPGRQVNPGAAQLNNADYWRGGHRRDGRRWGNSRGRHDDRGWRNDRRRVDDRSRRGERRIDVWWFSGSQR
ncbi:MAG: hypothetical protein AAGB51_03525 [Planctomycetota bacterium]